MWLILFCSILSVAVFFERLVYYHRCSVSVDEVLTGITKLVQKKKFREALDRCDDAYGPSVRVIQTAIIKRNLPRSEVKEIVQEVAQLEVPKLEANLGMLATVGQIAPLLGLLGTVTGMIDAFAQINQAMGTAPVSELADGIWEALITTAAGLGVAIPVHVAYNFLAARLNSVITDMERSGIEIIQAIYDEPVVIPPQQDSKNIPIDSGQASVSKAAPPEPKPGESRADQASSSREDGGRTNTENKNDLETKSGGKEVVPK